MKDSPNKKVRSMIRILLILLMTSTARAEFKIHSQDSWSFWQYDKQAHLAGGMYLESALYNRLNSHKLAIGGTFILTGIYEIKDGYIPDPYGDTLGFSVQDWSYSILGAFLSAGIEHSMNKIIKWLH